MAKYKLGDIAPIQQGSVPESESYWLLNLDMVESNTGHIYDRLYVPFDKIGTSTIAFDANNVLYSKLRPYLNKVVIPDCPGYATSEMLPLKPNKNYITREYLTYFLRSPKFVAYINEKTSGAKMPRANSSDLKSVEIECPTLENQRHITNEFDRIISIVRLRQQQIQKLDELVKARFVELFGDPVLNPYNWDVVTIGDIVTDVRYGTSKPAVEGGKYPYLRMNNLTYDGHLDLSDMKYIDIPDNEIEKCIVRKGDVLFNRTNSIELVGKTCVFDLDDEMVIAGYIIRVRLNEKLLPIVLSSYMNLTVLKEQLRNMAKGAVNQANINAQELQSIKIYLPPIKLQEQFAAFIERTDKSKVAVQKALDEAQLLFDSLMQKYFG